jgi:hypothetical protein
MDSNVIVAIVCSVFASTGFWAVVNNILTNKRANNSNEREALLGLLHDRIYVICKSKIKAGEISVEEYDNLNYLYVPYIALGGNGTCKKLKSEVDQLPIVDGE